MLESFPSKCNVCRYLAFCKTVLKFEGKRAYANKACFICIKQRRASLKRLQSIVNLKTYQMNV